MGGNLTKPTLFVDIIGGNSSIIKRMFSNIKIEKKTKGLNIRSADFKKRIEIKNNGNKSNKSYKMDLYFDVTLYDEIKNELDETNLMNILEKKMNEQTKDRKKNVIIKFGENHSDIFFMLLDMIKQINCPQIAFIVDKPLDININLGTDKKRYITYIIKEKNEDNLFNKIISYLWERDCYYNERGNLIYEEINPNSINNKMEIKSTTNINIVLTGISRAGKSSLINKIMNKLVSYESPELESMTQEIMQYRKKLGKNNKNGQNLNLTLIDTPGLTKYKGYDGNYIDNFELVKNKIKKIFKESEESKDEISMIYFLLLPTSNLETFFEFFNFLVKFNEKRANNKEKKIPIIFIINRSTKDDDKSTLIKFLDKYGYKESLYEKYYSNIMPNNQQYSGGSFRDRYMKIKSGIMKIQDDNIILANIISENENIKTKGIDTLLELTLKNLKKNNPFNSKDFKTLENFSILLERKKTNPKSVDPKQFEKEKEFCKNIMIKISNDNSLLKHCNNVESIIEKGKIESEKWIWRYNFLSFATGYIPFPFADLPACYVIQAIMIQQIAACFKEDSLPLSKVVNLILGLNTAEAGAKVAGNVGAYQAGKKMVDDSSKKMVKEIVDGSYHFVKSGGYTANQIVDTFAEPVSSNLLDLLSNLPLFKTGYSNAAEEVGKTIGKTVAENSMIDAAEFGGREMIKQMGENYGKGVSLELMEGLAKSGANELMEEGTEKGILQFSKAIPILGTGIAGTISGVLNYMGNKKIGENAVKYFEKKLNEECGCNYIMNLKNDFSIMFNEIEKISKENYNISKINII